MLSKPPLLVPSYKQSNNKWCNVATWTNVSQCHIGSYPAGGIGSDWGQTNLCYIAGKTNIPNTRAPWWWKNNSTSILKSVGLVSGVRPDDLVYSNDHVELRTWPCASTTLDDWSRTWDDFKDYVENILWSDSPRPIARGFSHSLTINGSDGEYIFLSNSSNGRYEKMSWEDFRKIITDKIDSSSDERVAEMSFSTGILHTPLRPEEQRRGVLILPESDPGVTPSISLVRDGNTLCYLIWDGSDGHRYGYYYEDKSRLFGERPMYKDITFGHSFQVKTGDLLRFSFMVQNCSFQRRDFEVLVNLKPRNNSKSLFATGFPVNNVECRDLTSNRILTFSSEYTGCFNVGNLEPGTYYLHFILSENCIVQDEQILQFKIAGRRRIRPRGDLSILSREIPLPWNRK